MHRKESFRGSELVRRRATLPTEGIVDGTEDMVEGAQSGQQTIWTALRHAGTSPQPATRWRRTTA